MARRRFGRTGLSLSVFSLGLMRGLEDPAQFRAIVRHGLAGGINHLETAPAYGPSETYLGQVLGELWREGTIDRSQMYITTKLVPTPDGKQLPGQLAQSLERLGTDYVDCVALHGLNTAQHWDWVQAPGGCGDGLEQVRRSGMARFVGFSSHGSLEMITQAIASDRFDFVNLHYGLFFQRHAPALAQAAALDLGVFIISPADKGGQLYAPSPLLADLCQPWSPLELAYRFLLADDRITTLSVGAEVVGDLAVALTLGQQPPIGEPLSPAERDKLAQLEQWQRDRLGVDRCGQCYQCLPCPEGIHIPEVLRLRNLAVAYGMEGFGRYRYGMFENAGHWFPGRRGDRCTDCGDCLPRCPQELDIPRLLRDTHDRLGSLPRRRLWD